MYGQANESILCRYAVWFGGSLMASLVCHPSEILFSVVLTTSRSRSSTRSATRRHSMTRLALVSADGTRFSEVPPRSPVGLYSTVIRTLNVTRMEDMDIIHKIS